MKTILLVDDDAQLRSMFSLALARKGYHVIEANSGVEGLALARKHLPDLIVSDIGMPGGDGSTLLNEIRRDPELRFRQVVLITGRPDLVTPRQGMENGADDFLVKPVSLTALLSCVEAGSVAPPSVGAWRTRRWPSSVRSCPPTCLTNSSLLWRESSG